MNHEYDIQVMDILDELHELRARAKSVNSLFNELDSEKTLHYATNYHIAHAMTEIDEAVYCLSGARFAVEALLGRVKAVNESEEE